MRAVFVAPEVAPSCAAQERRDRMTWWLLYAALLVVTLAIAAVALRTNGSPFSLAALVLGTVLVVAVVRPVLGLYLTVFFAVIGDPKVSAWYPVTKNFSSRESILFLSDQLVFSPLELLLAAITLGWVLQMAATRSWRLQRGPLFWPMMVFAAFMYLGFVYGVGRSGNTRVALWEIRPFLVLPLAYVLLTSLVTRSEQYRRLFWCLAIAVTINGVLAYSHLQDLAPDERLGLQTLVAHGSTLPMNALLILTMAVWLFRPSSAAMRYLLPVLAVPVVVPYLVSERRAAIAGLIVGVLVLGMALWSTNRRLFWRVAPLTIIFGVGYVAAFWNADGALGAPALTVKSFIAPEQLSSVDQASDIYRYVENLNILYTIRSNPVTGIGFGQPFYQPYTLPYIVPFLLAPFVPHNTVLWVWIKGGLGGFVAMLYLFAKTMRSGARAVIQTAGTAEAAITITSVAYIVGYLVFAYVDLAWDPQNMVVLALAMAQIDSVVSRRGGQRPLEGNVSGNADERGDDERIAHQPVDALL